MKIVEEGLTFDDVLLIPQKSSVISRRDVDISTYLTPQIKLQIPVISANMDTVTESRMAIALAQEGGVGFIHRYLDIERQVAEVQKVKRAQSYIIGEPLLMKPSNTLQDVLMAFKMYSISGAIVVDEDKKVVGIVTQRDVILENDPQKTLNRIMTKKVMTEKYGISLGEARNFFKRFKYEKLPLVDSEGRIKALITIRDMQKSIQYPNATKDKKGRLLVGAAIGVKEEDLDRAAALVSSGVDILVIDVAHGHSNHAISMVRKVKRRWSNIPVVAGNVATADGVRDLALAGADIVKVGVGPGTTCITRIVSGSGYPQLSAVINCSKEAKRLGVTIIADGGIAGSGDLAKAIGAGADCAMLGGFFSGTEEAPGYVVIKDGRKYKKMRGMASLDANLTRKSKEVSQEDVDNISPEGVEALVPYRGMVTEVLRGLIGGLRSGFSYCGAKNINEMWKKAKFVRITNAGMREGKPHDLEVL